MMAGKKNNYPADRKPRSWSIIIGMCLGFILWGLLLFRFIGDKGMPSWNYGGVEDVPGISPYSTSGPKEVPTLVPSAGRQAEEVEVQHVMEPPGKRQETAPSAQQR